MTITPNAPTDAGQAPRWLRVVTGCLLFLALWVAFVLVFGTTVPRAHSRALPLEWWGPSMALPAGIAAWLMVRRASARLLAPLAVIVLVGLGGFALWLGTGPEPQLEAKSGATAPPREPPKPTETAEVPPPPPAQPMPVPAPTPTAPSAPTTSSPPTQGAPGGGPARAETIPQFPWPPPAASATYVLPETVFE